MTGARLLVCSVALMLLGLGPLFAFVWFGVELEAGIWLDAAGVGCIGLVLFLPGVVAIAFDR